MWREPAVYKVPTTAAREPSPLHEVVTQRSYWVWSATAQLCRAPTLMAAMAFSGLTAVTEGSAKDGGLLVSSLVLAQVVVAGAAGRLLDGRDGQRLAVLATVVATAALAGIAGVAALDAPIWALCLPAATAGAALSGLPGLVRHRLNAAIPLRLLEPALSVDATVVEVLVVGAPVVVSVTLLAGPYGGVLAMAVTAGVAALLLGTGGSSAATAEATAPAARGTAVLWSSGFVAWMMVSFAFGHALGAIETAALALAETLRSGPFGGGAILAILAVSSVAAGLAYAALAARFPGRSPLRASVLLLVVAVATAAVGQADSWLGLGVAVVLVGLSTAPLNAIRSFAVEPLVPESRRQEGFSLLYTANGLGFAASGLGLYLLPLWAALTLPATSCVLGVLLLGVASRFGARRG